VGNSAAPSTKIWSAILGFQGGENRGRSSRKIDVGPGSSSSMKAPSGRRGEPRGRLLDAADHLHDQFVLQPHLVVEVAAQLLGQARHRSLRHLAGFQPVVVDAQHAFVRLELAHRRQAQTDCEQFGQLLLPRRRHQKVPEGAEASALVRIADGVALAEQLVQQRAPATRPGRDLFAHGPIEVAKALLKLAEVRQQRICRGRHLHEAIPHLRRIHDLEIAVAHALDFGRQLGLALSSSASRACGSTRVPSTIWRKSSNTVSRRDSVPTNCRCCSPASQARAFSLAGVRSKWGSSLPGG
jgi:hypothetical protein